MFVFFTDWNYRIKGRGTTHPAGGMCPTSRFAALSDQDYLIEREGEPMKYVALTEVGEHHVGAVHPLDAHLAVVGGVAAFQEQLRGTGGHDHVALLQISHVAGLGSFVPIRFCETLRYKRFNPG